MLKPASVIPVRAFFILSCSQQTATKESIIALKMLVRKLLKNHLSLSKKLFLTFTLISPFAGWELLLPENSALAGVFTRGT